MRVEGGAVVSTANGAVAAVASSASRRKLLARSATELGASRRHATARSPRLLPGHLRSRPRACARTAEVWNYGCPTRSWPPLGICNACLISR